MSTARSTAQYLLGGQSRCRTARRSSTEARRALGALRSSLLASSPPVAKAKGADAKRASRDAAYPSDIIPEWRAKSSRNAGRDQIGLEGDIISDSRATSPGIRSQRARSARTRRGRARRKTDAGDL